VVVRVEILWQTTGMPAHNERVILDLETENHVIRGARLRIRDGEVIAYELACVPIDLLPETDGTSAFVDIHALAAAKRRRRDAGLRGSHLQPRG